MRLKHFLLPKDEHNHESWTSFVKYLLATTLFNLHKDFRYLISNSTLKTDQTQITFYVEDIITFIKEYHSILSLNSKTLYQEIIRLECKYNIIGLSI